METPRGGFVNGPAGGGGCPGEKGMVWPAIAPRGIGGRGAGRGGGFSGSVAGVAGPISSATGAGFGLMFSWEVVSWKRAVAYAHSFLIRVYKEGSFVFARSKELV